MCTPYLYRVNTYRDITSVPTFFVRTLGKLLKFTGNEYTIQDGGSPFNYWGNLPSMRSKVKLTFTTHFIAMCTPYLFNDVRRRPGYTIWRFFEVSV